MAVRRILTLALAAAVTCRRARPRPRGRRRAPIRRRAAPCSPARRCHTRRRSGSIPRRSASGVVDEVYVAVTGVVDQLHIDLAAFGGAGLSSRPAAAARHRARRPASLLAVHLSPRRRPAARSASRPAPTPPRSFPDRQAALRYHDARRRRARLAGLGRRQLQGHQRDLRRRQPVAPEHVPPAALRARHRARRRCRPRRRDQRLRRRAVRPRQPARRPRTTTSTSARRCCRPRISGSTSARWTRSRATSGSASAITRRPASRCRASSPATSPLIARARDVAAGADPIIHGQSVVEIQLPASVDAELRARLHRPGRSSPRRSLGGSVAAAVVRRASLRQHAAAQQHPRVDRAAARLARLVRGVGRPRASRHRRAVAVRRPARHRDRGDRRTRTSPLTIAPTSFTAISARRSGSRVGWSRSCPTVCSSFRRSASRAALTIRGDQLACMASGYDYATGACAAVRGGYAIASGAGNYDRIEHAFRIGLRYGIP